MLLNAQGAFTPAMLVLLHGVTGVELPLLERARIHPHTANWLRFPWYPAQRGGAFVLGDRIYLLHRSLEGARRGDPVSLLLLVHEAGHLPQAARFGLHAWGRTRFVAWAAAQYALSALRHGRQAHDNAPLEREADEGRWILQQVFAERPQALPRLLSALSRNDVNAVQGWVDEHGPHITALRTAYRRQWPR